MADLPPLPKPIGWNPPSNEDLFNDRQMRTYAQAAVDAAVAAERSEPLTPEQIIEIRDELLPSQGELFDCVAFARAIEAAHGIREADHGLR